jgi:hypothetical protein
MKLISNNLSLKKIGAGVGIGVVFGAFTRAAGLFALIGLISLATPYLLPKDQEVILLIFLSQISCNTKKGIKPIKCSPLFRGYTDSPYSGNLQKLSECRDLVIWGENLPSTVGVKFSRAELASVSLPTFVCDVIVGILLSDA